MQTPEDIAGAKRELRTRLRAARRALTAEEHERRAEGWAASAGRIATLAAASHAGRPADSSRARVTIAAYLPAPGEPDPTLAMRAWFEAGLDVVVPVSLPGRELAWFQWTPDTPTRRGEHAPVPEPVGAAPADPELIDLVVVPALAVGDDGVRLGQGGGYYDSFLSGLHVPTIACVGAEECLGAVPHDTWDAVLDAVWTPEFLQARPVPARPAGGG